MSASESAECEILYTLLLHPLVYIRDGTTNTSSFHTTNKIKIKLDGIYKKGHIHLNWNTHIKQMT